MISSEIGRRVYSASPYLKKRTSRGLHRSVYTYLFAIEVQAMSHSWDRYFMSMVYLVAMKSKDPSTKIGAVVVGPGHEIRSTGYNGPPRGVDDEVPERLIAPRKYFYFEHAERNACYSATRSGISLEGCTMYTHGTPCADCARAIIQVGINKIVVHKYFEEGENRPQWSESLECSRQMLAEAGIAIETYEGDVELEIRGCKSGKDILRGDSLPSL